METEEWRYVPGFEGYYQISSFGNVKSLHFNRNIILKPQVNNKGYAFIKLSVKDKATRMGVHQLVAMAFLNHVRCGQSMVVDHIDFNRLNNHVYNLRVVTNRDNTTRRKVTHSSQFVGVHLAKNKKSWRAEICVNSKNVNLGHFKTEVEAHNAYQSAKRLLKK